MPKVSIILPTYNRGYILNQAIDSVLAQSYGDWELIIVDDGSTDGTKEDISTYLEDFRIRYLYQENAGQATARNRGVEESVGDIIMYLDSDDVYFSEAVQLVVNVFEHAPHAVFGVANQLRKISLTDNNHTVLAEQEPVSTTFSNVTLTDLYHWNIKFCGSSIFHKREVWEKGIIWDATFPYFEDWHFLLSIGNFAPDGFVFIPELLCEYRLCFGAEGINAQSTYQDLADAFESVYQAHKDDPLMEGQQWYPERVEKYTLWQKEVEAGIRPSATYKYFGDYLEKQKTLTT